LGGNLTGIGTDIRLSGGEHYANPSMGKLMLRGGRDAFPSRTEKERTRKKALSNGENGQTDRGARQSRPSRIYCTWEVA